MKLLVFEHASGGGFADAPLPQGVLTEGVAMLRAVIADFKAAGHEVTTLLDSRVATFSPPLESDFVVSVSSQQETKEALRRLSESADAACVIAPETDKALQLHVASLEQTGVTLLNCSSRAIEEAGDKAVLHEHLRRLGVLMPETMVLSVQDGVTEIKRAVDNLGFPAVFKPLDGVSCLGLSVVRSEAEVGGAVSKLKRESTSKHFLVQKLVNGVTASVCLISTGDEALPVSLNRQDVTLGASNAVSSYDGGLVPLDSPLKCDAFAVAKKVVESFRELRGFVGVDLVLTDEEPVVVEVNPRLTMSYVGLRNVTNFNLAHAIVNAVLLRQLPADMQTCGYAYFSKVTVPCTKADAFREACRMSQVVSPPFPFRGDDSACAILLCRGSTVKEALARFSEAKKQFFTTINGGRQRW
ncbi:ATP-grasp domain-containing protein [Candidatus Bathyarchaeota archaeon A05DMB-2]|nr:ATP-grasp domain-containing protein [Candidatus Bathyarchaeota archaeon A05DMB-2]